MDKHRLWRCLFSFSETQIPQKCKAGTKRSSMLKIKLKTPQREKKKRSERNTYTWIHHASLIYPQVNLSARVRPALWAQPHMVSTQTTSQTTVPFWPRFIHRNSPETPHSINTTIMSTLLLHHRKTVTWYVVLRAVNKTRCYTDTWDKLGYSQKAIFSSSKGSMSEILIPSSK